MFAADGKLTITQGGAPGTTWYKVRGSSLTAGSVSGLREQDAFTWKVSGDTLTLKRADSLGAGSREQALKRVQGQ